MPFAGLGIGVIEIFVYFIIGLIALIIGRKVFDLITPYDLDHETSEKDNFAASITEAGFYVGLAILIHASVAGEVNYSDFPFLSEEEPNFWLDLLAELISTFVYFFAGLFCLAVGRKILNMILPYDVDKEIVEDRNLGVGMVEAAFYISIAIIIHGILVN